MNTKQQNVLRSLLKKYQFKNVSNMVRMALGINYENFLQKTEPLYVIPRIASCYQKEEDRNILNGKVYKEWLDMVVRKRWVAPINEYIDQYGAHIVLGAIYYLIDNNLWDVYEGRLALDAREDNYYDKLSDMPSAIDVVKDMDNTEEQNAQDKNQEVQTNGGSTGSNTQAIIPDMQASNRAAQQPSGKMNITRPDWWNDDSYILTADDALSLESETEGLFAILSQNITRLGNYIVTAADSDVLRKKINDQQKEIENLNILHQQQMSDAQAQHQTVITNLQVQIDELKAKLQDYQATAQKASDFIAKQRAEAREAQKQYDELNAKYKKALDERDDADKELTACKKLLDEEANKEQLPKKKVIPRSALDSVPLLGRGVMTGLVPVLAKYNIMVDPNR